MLAILESMNSMLAASETSFVRQRDLKKNCLVAANLNQNEVDPAIQHILKNRQATQAKLAAQIAIEVAELIHSLKLALR